MEKDLIFLVGETLLMEIPQIKSISYPKGEFNPTHFDIELDGDEHVELSLRKI